MGKKINLTVTILSVLLVLALGYIAYDKYADIQSQKQMTIYQQGAQLGYEQAISQIYQSAAPPNCQQVPLYYNNQTINIVSVECLQSQS